MPASPIWPHGGKIPAVSAEGWPRVQLKPGRRRRRARNLRRRAGAKRPRIFERDEYACVLCGATDTLTLDHVRPLAYGGTNDDANLRTLCDPCNSRENVDFYVRAYAAVESSSTPSSASRTA